MRNFTFLIKRRYWVLTLISWIIFSGFAQAQDKPVSGKVIDAANGDPLIGATINVVGTTAGTAADINGEFKVNVPANGTLQIKSIGYATVTIPADFSKHMLVKLSSNRVLNEVVVVGYGTQNKASVTGAVSTVSAKVFEDRGPINNPLESLQGEIPGVIVTRTSAQPGRENWNFQIRGATSTNASDPLIILDGVALNSNAELNSINPEDIDNISVLKDAAAAIYGSRAAFGVVLITTKRAKSGKFTVQYDASVSQKLIGLQPTLVNDKQWGEGLMQALTNDNYGVAPTGYLWYQLAYLAVNPPASGYIDITKLPGYTGSANGTPYAGALGGFLPSFGDVKDFTFFDTNQQQVLWGRATSTQHNLSFSGSTEKAGYRVSLGYLNDGSQLQWGANGNQRYNIRFNHDYSFNDKIKLSTSVSLERNDIQQPTLYSFGSYGSLGTYGQPGMPAFTSQGQAYAWGTVYSAAAADQLGGDNLESNIRALLNTTLTYNFAKHLSFTGTAGYNEWFQDSRIQQKQIQFYNYAGDILVQTTPTAGLANGNGSFYNRQSTTEPYYNLIGRINYNNTFNKIHEVGLMIGSSYERDEYDSMSARTYNLSNDNITSLGAGLSNTTAGFVTDGEVQNHYALNSYFGRATYAYKSKYLFEAIGRYDGTSKFIASNRWKFFYGFLGGWRISEEGFMKRQNVVDNLKLKVSYGTTGNQTGSGIGLYDYLQLLNVNSGGALLGASTATSVVQTNTLVSLDRTWETVKNKNIGLEFGVLHNQLTGSFDIYQRENINMLLGQSYPAVLGNGAPALNIGDLQTWGYEASLTWKSKVGDLSYSITGTLTDNQNKLIHYGGASVLGAGFNGPVEGYPLNSYFGLQYDGRIQTQAQLDAYNAKYANTSNNINLPVPSALANPAGQFSGLRPGDNMFRDVNGDGKLTIGTSTSNPGDLVYLGSDDPRYSFGLNLGLQWKGFDFYSIFQGVGKRTVFRNGNWRVPYLSIFQGQTQAYVGNTWSPDNQNAYYPNLHSAQNNGINNYNYQISTWSVENGAYLRLKNLVIGYTLPKKLLERTHAISGLRFYFSGSDLWEISNIHDGWDPETTRTVNGNERYPFYRYITLGANVTF